MKANNDITPVEVFCGTIVEAEMVRSLLENAEIEVFLKNESIGTLAPWHSAPGGFGAVKVIVSSANYTEAIAIVKEYEKNAKESIE